MIEIHKLGGKPSAPLTKDSLIPCLAAKLMQTNSLGVGWSGLSYLANETQNPDITWGILQTFHWIQSVISDGTSASVEAEQE